VLSNQVRRKPEGSVLDLDEAVAYSLEMITESLANAVVRYVNVTNVTRATAIINHTYAYEDN